MGVGQGFSLKSVKCGYMRVLNVRHFFWYLAISVALFGMGWYSHAWHQNQHVTKNSRRITIKGYKFTSPLLDVELPEGIALSQEPISFKRKIIDYVGGQVKAGNVRDVSVYFRDLIDGPWFGVNENREFDAASMMKVPVMIAWLKRAENDPKILSKRLVYDGKLDFTTQQGIKPQKTILSGKFYTVDELLHYMMNYSDNNATSVLFGGLTQEELGAVLDGMDIDNHPLDGGNFITVHGYSGFFRILYNASFLNREMSEKALQLLSLQDFPQGMASGLPKGTIVAAKFGESGSGVMGEVRQLHEFGIIYHPNGAYILGIMAEGRDVTRLSEVIKMVSSMIYTEVSAATSKSDSR